MRAAGLILAGGRGSRMGSEVPKSLVDLSGRTLLGHVLRSFAPEFEPVLISANDRNSFASLGHTIVADRVEGFQGPLAGLDAAGAFLAEHRQDVSHVLALPGDTPFLPACLGRRLLEGAGDIVRVARHRGRLQPTVALWPMDALLQIEALLALSDDRSIVKLLTRTGFEAVDFADEKAAPDGNPFFNVNTAADLDTARRFLHGR